MAWVEACHHSDASAGRISNQAGMTRAHGYTELLCKQCSKLPGHGVHAALHGLKVFFSWIDIHPPGLLMMDSADYTFTQ